LGLARWLVPQVGELERGVGRGAIACVKPPVVEQREGGARAGAHPVGGALVAALEVGEPDGLDED